jgi:hypothetical protein
MNSLQRNEFRVLTKHTMVVHIVFRKLRLLSKQRLPIQANGFMNDSFSLLIFTTVISTILFRLLVLRLTSASIIYTTIMNTDP